MAAQTVSQQPDEARTDARTDAQQRPRLRLRRLQLRRLHRLLRHLILLRSCVRHLLVILCRLQREGGHGRSSYAKETRQLPVVRIPRPGEAVNGCVQRSH